MNALTFRSTSVLSNKSKLESKSYNQTFKVPHAGLMAL
jgi:hypothetical protein